MSTLVTTAEFVAEYRRLRACGLPVVISGQRRLTVIIGGELRAFIMPERWADQTREVLGRYGIGAPMFWQPGRRVAVLAGRHHEADDSFEINALLRLTDSVLVAPGRVLTLPTPGDSSCGWEVPVRDTYRPSSWSVMAALRTCAEQERAR
ncbi:hypothetical protein ACFVMC_08750 [Nocardia sp. NPDC127579]|uniref:hypothetical protein n=1 Tax=Nocardia sp. NPDC127579 TaxID=3345402 RepID=UPI00363B3F3A